MSFVMKIGMNAVKSKLDERKLEIDWNDYNYPPGLRIIHFKPEELEEPKKISTAKFQHMSFLLIILFYLINFVYNILDFFAGRGHFFKMLYSLFHSMIAIPLALAILNKGFRSLAGITAEQKWYKYGEIFIICFGVLAFLANFLCYHGLGYILSERKNAGIIIFIIGIIELGTVLLMVILRSVSVFTVIFKYGPKDEEK